MKQKKHRDWKFRIIFLTALAVFLFAAVNLGLLFLDYYKGEQEYKGLEGLTGFSVAESGTEKQTEDFSVDFEALRAINPDIVGWIHFEHMDISYPIVQGEDNEYYLSHSFYKEERKCGSIFMEVLNTPDFSDDNTFLYGHNMKDKSMFAKLNQFQEEQVCRENPEFLIYTPNGVSRYAIFSCYPAELGWDSFSCQFDDEEQYAKWLETVAERSLYETGVAPDVTQKTVTLMTCTPVGDNYRFLVHGALIEAGKK